MTPYMPVGIPAGASPMDAPPPPKAPNRPTSVVVEVCEPDETIHRYQYDHDCQAWIRGDGGPEPADCRWWRPIKRAGHCLRNAPTPRREPGVMMASLDEENEAIAQAEEREASLEAAAPPPYSMAGLSRPDMPTSREALAEDLREIAEDVAAVAARIRRVKAVNKTERSINHIAADRLEGFADSMISCALRITLAPMSPEDLDALELVGMDGKDE